MTEPSRNQRRSEEEYFSFIFIATEPLGFIFLSLSKMVFDPLGEKCNYEHELVLLVGDERRGECSVFIFNFDNKRRSCRELDKSRLEVGAEQARYAASLRGVSHTIYC